MRRGGNAVDAAVATGFALAVVHPEAGNIGGGGFMVIRMKDGSSHAIDYREVAPGLATRDMFVDHNGNPTNLSITGHLAAGVPGAVAGMAEAHRRLGRLPWREVVEPAGAERVRRGRRERGRGDRPAEGGSEGGDRRDSRGGEPGRPRNRQARRRRRRRGAERGEAQIEPPQAGKQEGGCQRLSLCGAFAALPRATTHAPVSVATSIRWVAPSCCAYHRPSPSTRRPSASVFSTSTVLPPAPVRMSPGLIARPPGMFSVAGTTPTTLIGAPSMAMARIAQMTAAPPAMSSFMRSMPSAGLIEMPPVSNVMPLPTRPSTGAAGAPGGSCVITMRRGGSALPRATPSSSPILSCAISSSSRTCTGMPASRPIAAARSAKTAGVSTFDGSLHRSRAMFEHSPRTRPRSTDRSSAGPPGMPSATRAPKHLEVSKP